VQLRRTRLPDANANQSEFDFEHVVDLR
jgi:hypothetical protein